jgi:hypothetical protein
VDDRNRIPAPLHYASPTTSRRRRARLGGVGRMLFIVNLVIYSLAVACAAVSVLLGR